MKLPLRPLSAGYTYTPGSEKAEVRLRGGRSWRRRTKSGASATVQVSWSLDRSAFDFFWAFFRLMTQRGVDVFQMDLVLEGQGLADVDCYLIGEPQLVATSACHYTVAATLEVILPAYDPVMDQAIIDGWLTYGDELAEIFDRLAIFANEDMPNTIGPP